MDYQGTIIEESLEDKSILVGIKIVSSKIEPSLEGDGHQTPWVKQWTLDKVEIPETQAAAFAEKLGKAIDKNHSNAWYIDYKTEVDHYIIFRDKVFHITDRANKAQYDEAIQYGIALGIPRSQMDVPNWRIYQK